MNPVKWDTGFQFALARKRRWFNHIGTGASNRSQAITSRPAMAPLVTIAQTELHSSTYLTKFPAKVELVRFSNWKHTRNRADPFAGRADERKTVSEHTILPWGSWSGNTHPLLDHGKKHVRVLLHHLNHERIVL